MSNLENVSVESLQAEIKRRKAEEEMEELVKQYGGAENLSSLVGDSRTLVYRFDKANRVLNPSTGKRGQKAKTS